MQQFSIPSLDSCFAFSSCFFFTLTVLFLFLANSCCSLFEIEEKLLDQFVAFCSSVTRKMDGQRCKFCLQPGLFCGRSARHADSFQVVVSQGFQTKLVILLTIMKFEIIRV